MMIKNLQPTLDKGAKAVSENSFVIGPQLEKAIEKETVQKTGAKLLTGKKLKGFFGGIIEKGLDAVNQWLDGDKKGAVLTFASGAVPLLWSLGMPGISLGVAAASVVAAIILKKMEEKESVPVSRGGAQCSR